MAEVLHSNFAASTIADVGGISDSDTSVDVQAGDGAKFPNPSGGDYFYCVLVDGSGNREIVKCTARSTDTLTIVREQQGTTGRAFSQDDVIELRATAGSFQDIQDEAAALDAVVQASVTTLDATVTLMKPFLMSRPKFENGSAYEIVVTPGFYYVKDKIAKWLANITVDLTDDYPSPSASTMYYLYLDYSAITDETNITASEMKFSTQAPSWNATYNGWYYGDDLCIFAFPTNSTPNDFWQFRHDGGRKVFVQESDSYHPTVSGWNLWDVSTGYRLPNFVRKITCLVKSTWVDGSGNVEWRPYGESDNNIVIGRVLSGQIYGYWHVDMALNSSQYVEIYSHGNDVTYCYINAWFFPIGM